MPSRSTLFLLLMFSVSAVSTRGAREGEAERTLVLDGGNLFDGSGGPVRSDSRIVVAGEEIVCVGNAESCPAPNDAQSIELQDGSWILPGLVDAHVHFGQTGWFDGRPSSLDFSEEFPYEQTMARQKSEPERYYRAYLCSGVTAVFDTGGYPWTLDLRAAAEHNPKAPHIAAAGPRITHAPPAALNLPAEQQYLLLSDEEAGEPRCVSWRRLAPTPSRSGFCGSGRKRRKPSIRGLPQWERKRPREASPHRSRDEPARSQGRPPGGGPTTSSRRG